MSDAAESPEVLTVQASYANAHPGELRRFVDSGGYVRIIDPRWGHETRVYWLSADPPQFVGQELADDLPALEALFATRRSEAARKGEATRLARVTGVSA